MKSVLRVVSVCGLLGVVSVGLPAWADPTRAEVESALSGFEQSPELATVRAWGSAGARVLTEVAGDARAMPHVRQRALRALRAFPGDATVQRYLRATAAAPNQDLFLLRASLDALVEGFDDVAEVSRYLAARDVDVRDGAAWSLANSRSPLAREALAARLRVETDPTVRITLATSLQRLATAPATPVTPVVSGLPATPSVSVRARVPRTRR